MSNFLNAEISKYILQEDQQPVPHIMPAHAVLKYYDTGRDDADFQWYTQPSARGWSSEMCHRADLLMLLINYQAKRAKDFPGAMNVLLGKYHDPITFAQLQGRDRERLTPKVMRNLFPIQHRALGFTLGFHKIREDNHASRQLYVALIILNFLGIEDMRQWHTHPRTKDWTEIQAQARRDFLKRQVDAATDQDSNEDEQTEERIVLTEAVAASATQVANLMKETFLEDTNSVELQDIEQTAREDYEGCLKALDDLGLEVPRRVRFT